MSIFFWQHVSGTFALMYKSCVIKIIINTYVFFPPDDLLSGMVNKQLFFMGHLYFNKFQQILLTFLRIVRIHMF